MTLEEKALFLMMCRANTQAFLQWSKAGSAPFVFPTPNRYAGRLKLRN